MGEGNRKTSNRKGEGENVQHNERLLRVKVVIQLVRVHLYIIIIIVNIYLFIIELIIYYIDEFTLYMESKL